MDEDRWKTLEVWKLADKLAFDVYSAARDFPRYEVFGLTSQLRRSALSIPTNIVEGYSRKGDKELAHFVNISLGSLAETKYLLEFAFRIEYISNEKFKMLKAQGDILGKKLWRFYEKIR